MSKEEMVSDLTPFCDLGEASPKVTEKDGKLTAKLVRDGRQVKVIQDLANGKVQVTFGTNPTKYFSSFQQMLAGDGFANLRRWADSQRDYLKREAVAPKDLIPIRGRKHDGTELKTVDEIEALLGEERPSPDSAEVVLVDGPAGIGKTTLIEQMALKRAEGYRTLVRPLFLHVKSRGRVLSNLQDLMAFSLQTLRLSITYDQVPVLVKHGLVVLAIDGFDELGDPSGYELAWAQVNDLVTSVRGHGTVLLAGRDTFIGRERLLRDVKALRRDHDVVTEVVLDVPTPEQAKAWLKISGQWTEASFKLPAVAVLLEPKSYALRPVFLRLLREQIKPKEIKEKSENDLASLLVNHMVDREATKFGAAVENALTLPKIKEFVKSFLKETARDMADSQAESLDAGALVWISEAALGSGLPKEIESLIKNRVSVIAFLADDERPGHKRFSHVQIMNYFLAHVTLEAVSDGDVPKFVRRNLFGKEFLSVFGDVMLERSGAGDERVTRFFDEAFRFSRSYAQMDRGMKNIGSLLFAALPAVGAERDLLINGFQIDEAVVRRTASKCRVENVAINQLDARGADLSAIEFNSTSILRLIGDEATKLPVSFPNVTMITDGEGEQIAEGEAIAVWIDLKGRKQIDDSVVSDRLPSRLVSHPAYKLLGRACRLRQYWLRSEGDIHALRILNDKWWPMVANVLRQHALLREEVDRQASGRSSTFYHIRQADRLLTENAEDVEIRAFYQDMLRAIDAV